MRPSGLTSVLLGAAAPKNVTETVCPNNPKHQTSIVVTDGKVDASELRYKEEEGGDGKGGDGGDE